MIGFFDENPNTLYALICLEVVLLLMILRRVNK
jgi:hypothetical protein